MVALDVLSDYLWSSNAKARAVWYTVSKRTCTCTRKGCQRRHHIVFQLVVPWCAVVVHVFTIVLAAVIVIVSCGPVVDSHRSIMLWYVDILPAEIQIHWVEHIAEYSLFGSHYPARVLVICIDCVQLRWEVQATQLQTIFFLWNWLQLLCGCTISWFRWVYITLYLPYRTAFYSSIISTDCECFYNWSNYHVIVS